MVSLEAKKKKQKTPALSPPPKQKPYGKRTLLYFPSPPVTES